MAQVKASHGKVSRSSSIHTGAIHTNLSQAGSFDVRQPGIMTRRLFDWRNSMVVPYIAGDVLELGCGLAPVKGLADEKISHYCGIDSDPLVLDQARREHPNSAFFCRNIEKDSLGFEQEFDVVLMVALIEHIFNQGHLFEQAVQALKPGGRIVVTTPTPFGNDIVHRFGAAIGLFSKLAAAQHIVIYDKRRFKIAAQQFGLQLESHALFQLGCNQLAVLRKNG